MIIDSINNIPSNSVSYEELSQLVSNFGGTDGKDTTSGVDRLFCFELQGSSPGCCGNYSGPCWFCHSACMWHDLECWCCDSLIIGCGPDCESEEGC